MTVLVRFALLTRPTRLAVDTKFVRFAVLIIPARLAVDTKLARLAVETTEPHCSVER